MSIPIPQQEADHSQSLPKADDCYAKTSKWLDLHDVDTQTNRLAPQKDRGKEADGRPISDSDGTESDLESQPETDSSERTKSSQPNRRKSRDQKGSPSQGRNCHEVTANKYQTKIVNRTLPKENSNECDS